MSKIVATIGRILIAVIFIVSGIGKLTDPAGTAQMLASASLAPSLAIPVGLFELIAGIALALLPWLRRGGPAFWQRSHGVPAHPAVQTRIPRVGRAPRR